MNEIDEISVEKKRNNLKTMLITEPQRIKGKLSEKENKRNKYYCFLFGPH